MPCQVLPIEARGPSAIANDKLVSTTSARAAAPAARIFMSGPQLMKFEPVDPAPTETGCPLVLFRRFYSGGCRASVRRNRGYSGARRPRVQSRMICIGNKAEGRAVWIGTTHHAIQERKDG